MRDDAEPIFVGRNMALFNCLDGARSGAHYGRNDYFRTLQLSENFGYTTAIAGLGFDRNRYFRRAGLSGKRRIIADRADPALVEVENKHRFQYIIDLRLLE